MCVFVSDLLDVCCVENRKGNLVTTLFSQQKTQTQAIVPGNEMDPCMNLHAV